MRILVAADAADLDAKVSKRFGHAPYFLVVDSEKWKLTAVEGVGEHSPEHGADQMVVLGVAKVATGNIGPNAFDDLSRRGLEVHICRHVTVREAVERLVSRACRPADGPTLSRSVHEHKSRDHHHRHAPD
jgi:predicted Fe-Mo cluster-binding NifX family protein